MRCGCTTTPTSGLRDVGTTLAARGGVMPRERIREWGLRFGRPFANTLQRGRPRPHGAGPAFASDRVQAPSMRPAVHKP